ncbi:PP2C family serine/threonine-protein phosphatase [Bacillus sp. AK128]
MTITHWKLANAQVVGRSHLKQQLPCQDYTLSVQTPDMTILVLADGAGSASSSHIGSKTVVHKMINVLQMHFEDMFKEEDHQLLRKRIIGILLNELEGIDDFSGNIKDYASTLLYVAIKGDRYLAGHIGDGVIGLQVAGGNFKVLSNPENGMYANTTYFITSDEAWKFLRLYKGSTEEKTGFILMSDGTAESLFNKQIQGFAPAITRMLDWLRDHSNQKISVVLETNLETVIKQQTQDDCSIALASLVRLGTEELLNRPSDYLTDFIGIHSHLMKQSFVEISQQEPALTENLQLVDDIDEEIIQINDERELGDMDLDNKREVESEEIDSTETVSVEKLENMEEIQSLESPEEESVNITQSLNDITSTSKDIIENDELEVSEENEK